MATPINTRILLRNDTLANWTKSQLALGKGEVAIATLDGGLAEVRVGTGSSTWANALKLNISTDQVSGLTDLISSLIGDGAKKYQVVSVDTNSWKLQQAALSGGDWSDVEGSTWAVDFTAINNAISGLTADVDYLSGQISSIPATYATKSELNVVSVALSTDYTREIKTVDDKVKGILADYLKAADKTELSNALTALDDAKLAKTDFAALSNEIGLSAASASNYVITKKDIGDLAGAMHFRGAVSAPSDITDPKAGDVVIVTSTSKEYVYNGTEWIELGDEALYTTKAEVSAISAELTANDQYLSGQITSITANYATKTELTGTAHDLSTDYNGKIDALSDAISGITGNYATKIELSDVSVALSTDYVDKIGTAKTEAYNEALSDANAYTNGVSAALSADYQGKIDYLSNEISTIGGTYATKDYVNGISSSLSTDYVGKIATAKSEVIGTTEDLSSADTINGAKKYAKNYTDGAVAALSIDDYIKHGKVVDTDLSGFFILSCGASSLRDGEPTDHIA